MIDRQGRLFGRLNVIDAALIVAIIAGLALYGARRAGTVKIGPPPEQPVTLSLQTDAITPETAQNIDKNAPLFLIVGVDAVTLGTVSDIQVKPAEVRIDDTVSGKVIYAPDAKRVQAVLTVKGTGVLTKQIVTVGGNTVLVGDTIACKTQRTRFNANVKQLKFGE
ncbi:MAG: DUF4330 domain-containing protein [Chloroflexi bacterium]|nr:DUF4330 domain-containing protein [Chloroflexota bacterium]